MKCLILGFLFSASQWHTSLQQGNARAVPGGTLSLDRFDRLAIACEDALGANAIQRYLNLPEHGILPNELSISTYHNITAFCASDFYGGLPESNMGGECRRWGDQSEVVFHFDNGDFRLFMNAPWRQFCQLYCSCLRPRGWNYNLHPPIATPDDEFLTGQMQRNARWLEAIDGWLPDSIIRQRHVHHDEGDLCGRSLRCTDYRCNLGRESGCSCVAENFDPRTDTFLTSSCVAISSGLRGRSVDDSYGCPCNASYVSRSCCDARDGLTWEDASLKMGRLLEKR